MEKVLEDLIRRYPALAPVRPVLGAAIGRITGALENGGTLFVCGNGGSGSDAEHIAGEFLKGFLSRREMPAADRERLAAAFGPDGVRLGERLQRGLRCQSLLSHPGFLTAFCNDVDPALIYAQQLYALGRRGDLLLGISTSGNAENVRQAFLTARFLGIGTILLTGARPGRCVPVADLVLAAPETETYRVQELHLPLYHALCMAVERHFFPEEA